MLKSKWTTLYGAPLVALTAALTLAACGDSDRVSDARDTAEQTIGQNDLGTTPDTPPDYAQNEDGQKAGGAVTRPDPLAPDPLAEGLDNPFELAGRSIDTASGEHLGQISKLVTDDAQNVYAVIEMDGADKTPEASGSLVVDIDEIDRTRNDLVLMSQDANLGPYVPEKYKPLGVRTEP